MPEPVGDIEVHVGRRLQAAREALGLAAEDVAEAVGITLRALTAYERGEARVRARGLYVLSIELKVPVAYFFEGYSAGGGT